MYLIEKENGQIFEMLETIKEVRAVIRDYNLSSKKRQGDMEIMTIISYKDGQEIAIFDGDIQNAKLTNIKSFWLQNTGTNIIYNKEIVYNEIYKDWEIK